MAPARFRQEACMAYDRYDPERRWRDDQRNTNEERGQRASWGRDREFERGRSDMDYDRDREDRGFFERMGEEVRSWFGDDDGRGRDYGRDRDEWQSRERSRFDESRPRQWNRSDEVQ